MSDAIDDAISALEGYIRLYPSGKFAELAQVRMDKLLALRGERKVEPLSSAGNPFSHGTVQSDLDYHAGDRYEFRVIDGYNHVEQRKAAQVVTALSPFEVTYDDGAVTDLLGNTLRREDGALFVGQQMYPAEYTVGKKWSTRYEVTPSRGLRQQVNIDFKVAAIETIEVPAGRFSAFRVEGSGVTRDVGVGVPLWGDDRGAQRVLKYWVAPDRVRRPLIVDLKVYPSPMPRPRSPSPEWVRWELTGYVEASRQRR